MLSFVSTRNLMAIFQINVDATRRVGAAARDRPHPQAGGKNVFLTMYPEVVG